MEQERSRVPGGSSGTGAGKEASEERLAEALRTVVASDGRQVLAQPQLLRAALLDELGEYPPSWRPLVDEVIRVASLGEQSADAVSEDDIADLRKALESDDGIDAELSVQALSVWCAALDIDA